MNRGDLTDEQWNKLQSLLPKRNKTGRPAVDNRRVINGILWILRTGAPWRDLPERYGKWNTVSRRFYRWRQAGVFDRLFATLQQEVDALGHIDWQVHFVDGTSSLCRMTKLFIAPFYIIGEIRARANAI